MYYNVIERGLVYLNVFDVLNKQEQKHIYDYAIYQINSLDEKQIFALFSLYDQAINKNDNKTAAKLELLAAEFFRLCKTRKLKHMLCSWLINLPSYIFEPEKPNLLMLY